MFIPLDEMAKATELTREGRLQEATELIQRALAQAQQPPQPAEAQPSAPDEARAPRVQHDVIDVEAREVPGADEPPAAAPARAAEASFTRQSFESGGKSYAYWLYKPAADGSGPLPLVVMLHGCTQDGQDFAQGTAMNELAARQRCIVVYPEQRQDSNSMRCWNWFEPAHQKRGAGEPAMIAALALEVAASNGGDRSRIYVAGLSAGGAMATLVAQLYPEVFAAAGVHSGLPAESARDMVSALSAMRKPGTKGAAAAREQPPMPTIVFHGNADRTVHPANGKRIVQEAVSSAGTALNAQPAAGGASARTVRRTVYTSPDGLAWVESWEIAGAPHAWAGGRAAGTYTDPQGPDASAAMLEFFLRHRRAA